MDLSKRRPSPNRSLVFPDDNPSDTQKRMGSQKDDESDENSQPSLREFTARWEEPPSTKHFMSATISSASKKKILSEWNQEASPDSHFSALLQNTPRVRSSGDRSPIVSSTSPNHVPYDPVTNYLSPRPQFLRYDPNRRREFIQRMEGTGSGDDESSSTSSSLSQEEVTQSDSEDDGIEDEAEGERLHCSTVVRKLLLLLGALMFLACCISSMNSPTSHYLQESGGFLESHLMLGNHSLFYGNSLGSLVDSLEICLIVHPRDFISQYEGIEYKPLVLDDLVNREEPEGKESDPVDSTTGHLMIPYKLAGRVDTEVDQVDDDIGLVKENEENVLKEKKSHDISDSTLGDLAADDLLVPEKLAKGVDTEDDQWNDGIGLLMGNQEDLLEGEESHSEKSDSNIGDSVTGDLLIPDKLDESVDVKEYRLNGRSRLATGNGKIILANVSLGIECQEFLVQDIVSNERPEIVTESSSLVPQTNTASDITSTDEIKEETEPSTVSELKVKWELSHIWICSLTAVVGLFTALYKYFTRPRQSALLESPSCSDSAVEGKTSAAVLMNEKAESKGLNEGFSGVETTVLETSYQDLEKRVAEILRTPVQSGHSSDKREELYGTHLPTAEVLRTPVLSRYSSDEHEELYASRPPTVELLGEFSFVDMKDSQTGSGQTERSRSKGSPLRLYERKGSKRKSPSSSANKVLPSSPVECVSNGSLSAQNKSLRKESFASLEQDTSERQKPVATTTTPLRRSGRLRSRVTSP